MNRIFHIALWLATAAFIAARVSVAFAATNVAPTPAVLSAAQRPGIPFMDIDYRVDDPDDATVQTAALGFANGGTNFSDIIKLQTLVEGERGRLLGHPAELAAERRFGIDAPGRKLSRLHKPSGSIETHD